MNIPNLPTDNLYKFISLSGVTIVLASFFFYGTVYIDILNKIDGMESEVSMLELDSKFITQDQEKLDAKISHLTKSFPVNENEIFPEKPEMELIKSENERIISLNRVQEKKIVQIKTKAKNILRLNHSLRSISNILGILVAVGILMAIFGFRKWYSKVQEPTDEKLAIELKNLVEQQQNRKN